MTRPIMALLVLLALSAAPENALARYRPGLDWRTIRTDRVTIYYPRGHEAFASRVLALTDEVVGDVDGFLGVDPRRCPIVLDPDTDLFNGWYEPMPNRISLYETPPYSLRWFGPVSDVIDQVYTHEYAHFAHITTRLGWYGGLTRVLGDGLALADGLSPGWLVEGIAVDAETRFTDGGRGRSPLFDGTMRSFYEGKGFWGLAASMSASPYHPPGNRIYLAGYYLTDFLVRRWGDDAVSRLVTRQARHPVAGTAGAIRHVTGLAPEAFYRAYRDDLAARMDAARARTVTVNLPAGRVLLAGTLDSFDVHVWTGHGTILALRNGYGRPDALVEVDPVTGGILAEKTTGRLDRVSTVRSTADGRLVYGRYFLHPLGGGGIVETDLGTFDPATGRLDRLTRGEHIFSADLSPDGSRFVAARRNGMWIDLVLVDAVDGSVNPLISREGLLFESPCWSPDGTVIATVAKVGAEADIVLVDPADGSIRPLFTPDAYEDGDPAFSPDGRWIVFASDRGGSWDICAWDLTERRLYRLTAAPYAAACPRVSPDGTMLSFTSIVRGAGQLCVMPFEPEKGMTVDVVAGGELAEPDLDRVAPDIDLESGSVPFAEAYRPYVHAPWFGIDEDGGMFGVKLIGGDPLQVTGYEADILYGAASGRPGYDITVFNRSFWPEINLRLYDDAEESDMAGGGSYWYRERGGELSLSLDVIHRTAPDVIRSYVSVGGRVRSFEGLDGVWFDPGSDRSVALFGAFSLARTPDHAPRDMVSGWGQEFSAAHEEAFSSLGGELPGRNTVYQLQQYAPLPFKHQGLALTAVLQRQSGMLVYDRDISVPRGYESGDRAGKFNARNTLRFALDWRFPIAWPDTGFGVIACHLYRISGSLFVDGGAGWNGGFDADDWRKRVRSTVGASVAMAGDLGVWLPVETGVSVGYRAVEKDAFAEFLFGAAL